MTHGPGEVAGLSFAKRTRKNASEAEDFYNLPAFAALENGRGKFYVFWRLGDNYLFL